MATDRSNGSSGPASVARPGVLSLNIREKAALYAAYMRSILGGGYPYLVAVDGDSIAGYAYASAFRPRTGYRHTVEDSIYVARAARGRGVGNALLGALIDACAKAGYRQMVAVIGGRDELPSIRLHTAHGFFDVGTLPAIGRKFGRWLDCVHMQRALGEGATTAPIAE